MFRQRQVALCFNYDQLANSGLLNVSEIYIVQFFEVEARFLILVTVDSSENGSELRKLDEAMSVHHNA